MLSVNFLDCGHTQNYEHRQGNLLIQKKWMLKTGKRIYQTTIKHDKTIT